MCFIIVYSISLDKIKIIYGHAFKAIMNQLALQPKWSCHNKLISSDEERTWECLAAWKEYLIHKLFVILMLKLTFSVTESIPFADSLISAQLIVWLQFEYWFVSTLHSLVLKNAFSWDDHPWVYLRMRVSPGMSRVIQTTRGIDKCLCHLSQSKASF